MADIFNNLQPAANPYEDRITAMLQKRSQPQEISPWQRMQAGKAAMAGAGYGGQGIEEILSAINQPQREAEDRAIESTKALYDIFEEKRSGGDKQAQALFDKVRLFTGDDPDGISMFIEQLHNDPDSIDPGNAYQVMTKLAQIKKQTGYESPALSLDRMKKEAEIQKLITQASPKERKLSATEQKELFDATDLLNASASAKSGLLQAKNILKNSPEGSEPYTGFAADTRAAISRVPVVGDILADKERGASTTEYTTLVTEQALNNLKAIFGGMPTEGERQILMQIQALATYTPQEQERIIDNAIAAADKRMQFNQQKLGAIQTGDYSGLGSLPPLTGSTQSGAPEVGAVEEGYEYIGGDPANQSSWRKVQ